ncbi:MAG: hypothetical protein IPM56_16055 [Ignavibacteriales bacterium]|nr:MAG: hypothetical protein IPM56_16055 [Ignavibacteriales bacterium]
MNRISIIKSESASTKFLLILIIISFLITGCSSSYKSVSDYPDSPCFDKRLIELESKQNLTREEVDSLILLKKKCEDDRARIADENSMDIVTTAIVGIAAVGLAVYIFFIENK